MVFALDELDEWYKLTEELDPNELEFAKEIFQLNATQNSIILGILIDDIPCHGMSNG